MDARLTNGNNEGDNTNSNETDCSNGMGIRDDLQNGLNNDDGQENENMNGDKDDEEDINGQNMNGFDDSHSTSDDDLTNKRNSHPAIDLGDQRAESGCKDLRNIRKFSKAAEMMGWEINAGKRKKNIFVLIFIVTSGQSVFLSLSSQRHNRERTYVKQQVNKTIKFVNLNLSCINMCCFVLCF